ncbi:serine-threonine/tyrosine-protein kinase catalytic domain-containing protein [Rhodocollybia butyracea]|uniref:Serine-threonine/tyrosine-protein kinase catalytic domain-containing protein n=1 Tax=Rhodocollybia butyracea TaxID=206335 RepID=A0A9P5PJF7_9AGAR|nr:serine-threonine/tyrosine-protein kinase catalytic domain-containing protein [Rhodocollybia butyracea]
MQGGGGSTAAYRWMAPELLNDMSKMSAASDVFAYTMTCLEVYTGDIPFPKVQEFQVATMITRNEKPPRPSNVSDELWALWENGWEGDVDKRLTMTRYVERLNAMA